MEYKGISTLNKIQMHHYIGTGCDFCERKDRCMEGRKEGSATCTLMYCYVSRQEIFPANLPIKGSAG
jgi:hypothetical protein